MSHWDSLECLTQGSITDVLTCGRTSWYLDRSVPPEIYLALLGIFCSSSSCSSWTEYPAEKRLGMTLIPSQTVPLLSDIRRLILEAKSRAAMAVNAELTLLYWQVGRRIHMEVLKGARVEYGKQLVATLSKQLSGEVGKGWSEKQLLHCLRIAETFHDEQIFSSLRRELSWTHLKRDFYIEMCRLEHWSSRQLQERIRSMLFERTAISRKPEETIRPASSCIRRPFFHSFHVSLKRIFRIS